MDHKRNLTPGNGRPQKSQDFLLLWLPSLIMFGIALWLATSLIRPAPSRYIAISTGSKSGAYIKYGRAYARILARSGIELDVRTSRGTVENLSRLANPHAGVDVALVQGGVATPAQTRGLLSLGRIFYEPLWVFYRNVKPVSTLSELRGKRLAIGPNGSGTRALTQTLLKASGIDHERARLLPVSGKEAANALRQGEVDAIFIVASPHAPLVQDLLKDRTLRLMSFARAEAYARRFRFLAPLVLPRGIIDLEHNIPDRDIHLIAAEAALVIRKSLHPALASLLAEAASEVHSGSGLFHKAGAFPKPYDPVFRLSMDAKRFYEKGPPFLRRFLPFWLVVLIERLIFLALPLLTILIPLIKILPLAYRWRIRRRILRWYVKMNELERDAEHNLSPEHDAARMAELDRIENVARNLKVPLQYTDELYALREHVELVRQRLEKKRASLLSSIG